MTCKQALQRTHVHHELGPVENLLAIGDEPFGPLQHPAHLGGLLVAGGVASSSQARVPSGSGSMALPSTNSP